MQEAGVPAHRISQDLEGHFWFWFWFFRALEICKFHLKQEKKKRREGRECLKWAKMNANGVRIFNALV